MRVNFANRRRIAQTVTIILTDSDVLIDLLREYAPAKVWFGGLHENEQLMVPGYVVMELIQGCRNLAELDKVRHTIAAHTIVWPSPPDCDRALETFAPFRLSHGAGLFDVLIG